MVFSVPDHSNDVYIPRTQKSLVLIGKGIVLGGWPSKVGIISTLGIYKVDLDLNKISKLRIPNVWVTSHCMIHFFEVCFSEPNLNLNIFLHAFKNSTIFRTSSQNACFAWHVLFSFHNEWMRLYSNKTASIDQSKYLQKEKPAKSHKIKGIWFDLPFFRCASKTCFSSPEVIWVGNNFTKSAWSRLPCAHALA